MRPSSVATLCMGALTVVLFWQVGTLSSDLEAAVAQNAKLLANNKQLAATLVSTSRTYYEAAQEDHEAMERLRTDRDESDNRALSLEHALETFSRENKNCTTHAVPVRSVNRM